MPNETVDGFFAETVEKSLAALSENQIVLPGTMGQMQAAAEFLSKSTIIPSAYQGKPANCFVALEFAQRIGCNAMLVMQNLDIISGKPSWSSKFMVAVSNECGKYTPIRYEMSGTEGEDDWGCRAYMTEIATNEKLTGPKVTMKMAKDEGWYGKNGSKWKTMPELMLRYRAAAFLIRTYAPELTMGIHTSEEREDMINVTPVREKSAVEAAWEEQNAG